MAVATVDVDFSAPPSLCRLAGLVLVVADNVPATATAVGVHVGTTGAVPAPRPTSRS